MMPGPPPVMTRVCSSPILWPAPQPFGNRESPGGVRAEPKMVTLDRVGKEFEGIDEFRHDAKMRQGSSLMK